MYLFIIFHIYFLIIYHFLLWNTEEDIFKNGGTQTVLGDHWLLIYEWTKRSTEIFLK